MDIGDWAATPDLNEIYRDIRALGLETNLAELEAFGFTVIENAFSPELTRDIRETIIGIAEDRVGKKLDIDSEEDVDGIALIPYLLFKDPIFRQAAVNPKPMALITYLLGKHCLLSSMVCHLKGAGGPGLLLHADNSNGVPEPFTPYSQVANCNYALTDYTEEAGCLAMVPGSHRMHRQPTRWEVSLDGPHRNPNVIPIEVPAGSAIVWHGHQWHGSFPRKKPGLRVNLSTYYCREYMTPQENYRGDIPADVLASNDHRLARLLGADTIHGWKDEGPHPEFAKRNAEIARSRTWQN